MLKKRCSQYERLEHLMEGVKEALRCRNKEPRTGVASRLRGHWQGEHEMTQRLLGLMVEKRKVKGH